MNESPYSTSPAWSRATWISIAGFGIVVVALTLLAASGGLRGSDQYWYVGDVQTLVRDHAIATNTVFPVALLGPHPALPPPFVHNVLSIYLAALPATVLGAYSGWLALNLLATLASATLVYLAGRRVAAPWAALLCAILYPLLPLTFWYTAQPLAEASTALFAALAIYLLAVAGLNPVRWVALVAAVGLLYFSRESYLPLLLAAPIGFFVLTLRAKPNSRRAAVASSAMIAAVAVLFAVARNVLFAADNVNFSYTRLLHTAVPGSTTNMWFNFDLSPANLADRLPFDPGLVLAKLGGGLIQQFVSFESPVFALFYWTFNILVIVAVVMIWRCRRRPAQLRIVGAALALVAINLLTIAVFQNQVRYTMPATPGLLVVLAIALSEFQPLARRLAPRSTAIIVAMVVLALLPLAALALSARHEGVADGSVERATQTLLDSTLQPAEPVMIVYAGSPQLFAYAASPRLSLFVSPDYSAAELGRLRQAFPAHWILADGGSPVLAVLGLASEVPAGTVSESGTTWGLYSLP